MAGEAESAPSADAPPPDPGVVPVPITWVTVKVAFHPEVWLRLWAEKTFTTHKPISFSVHEALLEHFNLDPAKYPAPKPRYVKKTWTREERLAAAERVRVQAAERLDARRVVVTCRFPECKAEVATILKKQPGTLSGARPARVWCDAHRDSKARALAARTVQCPECGQHFHLAPREPRFTSGVGVKVKWKRLCPTCWQKRAAQRAAGGGSTPAPPSPGDLPGASAAPRRFR